MIAVGLGFRAGVSQAALARALRETLAQSGFAPSALACLCVPELKQADPELVALVGELQLPMHAFSLAALRASPLPTLTQSSEVLRRYGVGSISEACALLGALAHGKQARLLGPRTIAGSVTCALAISEGSS